MKTALNYRVHFPALLPDTEVVIHTRNLLPKLLRKKGITIGRRIFVAAAAPQLDTMLIAHELGHVVQWQQLGTWRFLREYLGGLVRHGYGLKHPMEREAYDYALTHHAGVAPVVEMIRSIWTRGAGAVA